jgi:pimeloyl-ACP methyl ester carboxylesterase
LASEAFAQTPKNSQPANVGSLEFIHNGDFQIAYREYGSGPLVILIHGFPDAEGTYSKQIEDLSKDHLVVTPRLRGFPPSSVPAGVENYQLPVVADDIRTRVAHFGDQKAIVVGHDWGGGVAQAFALKYPQLVSGLVIMNVPMIATFNSVIGSSKEQQWLASYTVPYIKYQHGDPEDPGFITRNIKDPQWRAEISAFLKDQPLDGMLSYYKANYPAPPYKKQEPFGAVLKVPTLIVWGMKDEYFSLDVPNDAPRYVASPLTLVTVPKTGHWVHRDAPEAVSRTIRARLHSLQPSAQ